MKSLSELIERSLEPTTQKFTLSSCFLILICINNVMFMRNHFATDTVYDRFLKEKNLGLSQADRKLESVAHVVCDEGYMLFMMKGTCCLR